MKNKYQEARMNAILKIIDLIEREYKGKPIPLTFKQLRYEVSRIYTSVVKSDG